MSPWKWKWARFQRAGERVRARSLIEIWPTISACPRPGPPRWAPNVGSQFVLRAGGAPAASKVWRSNESLIRFSSCHAAAGMGNGRAPERGAGSAEIMGAAEQHRPNCQRPPDELSKRALARADFTIHRFASEPANGGPRGRPPAAHVCVCARAGGGGGGQTGAPSSAFRRAQVCKYARRGSLSRAAADRARKISSHRNCHTRARTVAQSTSMARARGQDSGDDIGFCAALRLRRRNPSGRPPTGERLAGPQLRPAPVIRKTNQDDRTVFVFSPTKKAARQRRRRMSTATRERLQTSAGGGGGGIAIC